MVANLLLINQAMYFPDSHYFVYPLYVNSCFLTNGIYISIIFIKQIFFLIKIMSSLTLTRFNMLFCLLW